MELRFFWGFHEKSKIYSENVEPALIEAEQNSFNDGKEHQNLPKALLFFWFLSVRSGARFGVVWLRSPL